MFLVFVRVTPFSSSSPLRHISESYRWKTVSPWCFDPVPIRSCSRSGRGSDLNSHVLTLALPDDCSSNGTLERMQVTGLVTWENACSSLALRASGTLLETHSPNSQISRMSLLLSTLLLLHFVSNKIISQSNAGHTFKYSPCDSSGTQPRFCGAVNACWAAVSVLWARGVCLWD